MPRVSPSFARNNIPIIFAADQNYLPYLAVSIHSLLDNISAKNNYDIYILTELIAQNEQDIIIKLAETRINVQITFINLLSILQKYGYKNFHLEEERQLTIATYYRLFIPKIDIFNCAWGKLWKRGLFENIRFPEHMSAEDLATTPRLLAQIQEALVLPQRLFMYQYRKDSLDNRYTEQTGIDFGRAFAILEEFATQLERRHLLENFMQRQFEAILQRKRGGSEFQTAFVRHVPPSLSAKTLLNLSDRLQQTQQNRWCRFGQLSRKRKLWVIAKVLSKKMKIYKVMQPFGKVVKKIMKKREANT